ncbi:hypothetical protein HDU93_003749 [Gonapodya sp. JEL0774]|nr:hypothetical protein HDU93_003749 [Gonapodya sp. JEL0774]
MVIKTCIRAGKWDEALAVVEEMKRAAQEKNCSAPNTTSPTLPPSPYPDASTHAMLLRHLVRTLGDFPTAITLFQSYWSSYGSLLPISLSEFNVADSADNSGSSTYHWSAVTVGLAMEACVGMANSSLVEAKGELVRLAGWRGDRVPVRGESIDPLSPLGWLVSVGSTVPLSWPVSSHGVSPSHPTSSSSTSTLKTPAHSLRSPSASVPHVLSWFVEALLDLDMPLHALRAQSVALDVVGPDGRSPVFLVPDETVRRVLHSLSGEGSSTRVAGVTPDTVRDGIAAVNAMAKPRPADAAHVLAIAAQVAISSGTSPVAEVVRVVRSWNSQSQTWVDAVMAEWCSWMAVNGKWEDAVGYCVGYATMLIGGDEGTQIVPGSIEEAADVWMTVSAGAEARTVWRESGVARVVAATVAFLKKDDHVLRLWDCGIVSLELLEQAGAGQGQRSAMATEAPSGAERRRPTLTVRPSDSVARVVSALLASERSTDAELLVKRHHMTAPAGHAPANMVLQWLIGRGQLEGAWQFYDTISLGAGYVGRGWGDAETFDVMAGAVVDIDSAGRLVRAIEESGIGMVGVEVVKSVARVVADGVRHRGEKDVQDEEGSWEIVVRWLTAWKGVIGDSGVRPAPA